MCAPGKRGRSVRGFFNAIRDAYIALTRVRDPIGPKEKAMLLLHDNKKCIYVGAVQQRPTKLFKFGRTINLGRRLTEEKILYDMRKAVRLSTLTEAVILDAHDNTLAVEQEKAKQLKMDHDAKRATLDHDAEMARLNHDAEIAKLDHEYRMEQLKRMSLSTPISVPHLNFEQEQYRSVLAPQ
ncbi:hypothetical protein KFL_012430020 [Klebsormidium nitens]|uniref:Uncharacterized protein n=1 Tax=Klebsormidium nitens TaxID=105231 RepID=A0A1Y1IQP5_KLENI|nr:hypothetical protein KFL_012430020 [Klebsormidium nitens]|eukprot:GAQ93003.1 hypothetical protein KFL_012430020 [Klebsormidium nitens]